MKKTISALAILASTTTAHALFAPVGNTSLTPDSNDLASSEKAKVACIELIPSEFEAGVFSLGSCDLRLDNSITGRKIKENGCAEGQLAVKVESIKIETCATAIQL